MPKKTGHNIEVALAYGRPRDTAPKYRAIAKARWTRSQIILIPGTFQITEGQDAGCYADRREMRFRRDNGRRVGAVSTWDLVGWHLTGDFEAAIQAAEQEQHQNGQEDHGPH